jgi:LPS-assembly protein
MIFQILYLMFLGVSLFSLNGWSQSKADGVTIRNADKMYSDTVNKTVRMEGHVQVVFQQQILSCDSAMINMVDQTIEASGHVILETIKVHIEGSRLRFYYKTNVGLIYNGFVQSGQIVFEGELIEKTGPDNYVASNANFTACETCPPGWEFSGTRIEAEIGGYAYIKRPIFKIGGFPIFIFPAMMVPLKSQRESGFLVPTPELGSKGGFGFGESFFWAINRSQDLTLTGKYYDLRGPKAHEDYRYILSEDSKGRLESAVMTDRVFKNEANLPNPIDRYFVHYRHQFELPDNYVQRLDYQKVSDLYYTRDFPLELLGWGDPALESKLSVTKNMESHAFSVEAAMYTNQLKVYPLANNDDAVHRMPEIRYSKREEKIGNSGFMVRWDFDYANFAREHYSYDSLIFDPNTGPPTTTTPPLLTGNIDPATNLIKRNPFNPATDLIRTGQRMDFSPTISYPFQVANRFDVLPSVTYREMQYKFDLPSGAQAAGYDPTAARRYVQTDVTVRSEFSSVYGDLTNEHSERWKHTIEPELSYSQIPWMRYPTHPFFGNSTGLPFSREMEPISDGDLIGPGKMQFDYIDRVYDKKLVTLGFTNKLTEKTFTKGEMNYRRVALFRISQSYDFTQINAGSYQPWSNIDSLLNASFQNIETFTTASYNPYANIANISASVKGKLDKNNYVLLSYNHQYLVDARNNVLPGTETEDYGAGLGFTSKYFDIGGLVDYSPFYPAHPIQSFDYFVVLRPPGNCWHIKFEQRQDLGGETVIKFTFNLDFTGGQAGATGATNSTQI